MFDHIYEVKAKVVVECIIRVAGNTEKEARERLIDGAWHGVAPNWDKWEIVIIKDVKEFK